MSSTFVLSNPSRLTLPSRSTLIKAWIPVLLCACVFAIESTRNFGTDHTSAPLHSLYQALTGESSMVNWSYIHHIIRKIGHFSGYGTLSLVCFRGFWMTLRRTTPRIRRQLGSHGLALLATLVVASTDEIHQTFLPNRTGTFSDVVVDMSGAATMQIVLFLILGAIILWRVMAARTASTIGLAEMQAERRSRLARPSFQILGNGMAVITRGRRTWPTTIPTRPTVARWIARATSSNPR